MKTQIDILVIDDEPSINRVVVKVCKAEGMSIIAANNAADALHNLERHTFQLVLCDIMMHGLDGFGFLEKLAQLGIQTPVIMMTGYSTMENAVRSLASTGWNDLHPPQCRLPEYGRAL